jgi:hypothetical protein
MKAQSTSAVRIPRNWEDVPKAQLRRMGMDEQHYAEAPYSLRRFLEQLPQKPYHTMVFEAVLTTDDYIKAIYRLWDLLSDRLVFGDGIGLHDLRRLDTRFFRHQRDIAHIGGISVFAEVVSLGLEEGYAGRSPVQAGSAAMNLRFPYRLSSDERRLLAGYVHAKAWPMGLYQALALVWNNPFLLDAWPYAQIGLLCPLDTFPNARVPVVSVHEGCVIVDAMTPCEFRPEVSFPVVIATWHTFKHILD